MANLLGILNRLLPFATPGTPLVQDLLHLAAICVVLYYAPQLQNHLRTTQRPQSPEAAEHETHRALQADLHETGFQAVLRNPNEDQEVQPVIANVHEQDLLDHFDGQDGQNLQAPAEAGFDAPREGQPGPAPRDEMPNQRNIGAKKAKSLAKKDQRRAYHEFMRSQGEAQRARDAEGAAEREAALAAERERRRAAEAVLEAKKAKEREERRQREEADRIEELRRRDLVVKMVRQELERNRMCDLFKVAQQVGGDVDEEWVEKIVNASGVVGRKGDTLTFVTTVGWIVRVTASDMERAYQQAALETADDGQGKVDFDDFGKVLENIIRS